MALDYFFRPFSRHAGCLKTVFLILKWENNI